MYAGRGVAENGQETGLAAPAEAGTAIGTKSQEGIEMRESVCRTLGAAAALAALLCMAGPLAAQDAAPVGEAAAATGGPTSGTCTFDVRDRSIKDVIEIYIRKASNTNIVVASEAEKETVTLKVEKMAWRDALELIARRTKCTVEVVGNYLSVEKPPRVTWSFEQAEISKVIRTIAAVSGANIVTNPDEIKGMVTVNLRDVPWKRALHAIVTSKGYVLVEEPGGILSVVSTAKLKADLETRVYQLKYLRPPPDYSPKLGSTTYVVKTGTSPAGDIEKTFNIITSLREALKPEGGLEYINAANSFVLKGTKPKLAQVEAMLQKLDVEPMQVFIDMQFISTRNTDLFQMGMGPGDNGISGSMTMARIEGGVRLPFNTGSGGWEDWFMVDDLPVIGAWSPTTSYGNLDFSATSLILKVLKRDTKSRVVQAPKLFILDNQEATIFVGESIRYAQSEASSSQNGTLQFSVREADNSPVSTGFQLLLVPHVIPETDKVMMTLVPTQNSLTGTSPELPGFDKFTVGGGTAEQTIFLPRESSSTLITTLVCEHGTTAVLGGLMQETLSVSTNKVPWLGDIPFFGYLFKTEAKSKETRNLMIFLTPWLVKDASKQRESLEADLLRREPGLDDEWSRLMMSGDLGAMQVPGEPGGMAPMGVEPVKEPVAPEKKPAAGK